MNVIRYIEENIDSFNRENLVEVYSKKFIS